MYTLSRTALGLLACLALAVPSARADTRVEVGRVKLVLAEDGWEAEPIAAESLKIMRSGEEIRGEAKLLTLRGPQGRLQAAMVVFATWGTSISIRSLGGCAKEEGVYVRAFSGARVESPECAQVHIEAAIASNFAGLSGANPEGTGPAGFPGPVAAWLDAAGEASRSALRSLSATLEMPPMRFDTTP